MIKVVLYVISLAAAVAVAVWFANAPGTVTLDWLGWRVDTTVAMLFVLVIGLLLIGTFLVRVWSLLIGAGRAFRDARTDLRVTRGLSGLAAGFAAVLGGDVTSAQKGAREAEAAFGEHQAVRLLQQQTAHLIGDTGRASSEARELLTDAATELVALRDLAAAAKTAGDLDGALGHTKRALGRKTPPRWALDKTLDLQIALGRWEEAATTLERKDIQNTFTPADLLHVKASVYARAATAALTSQDSALAIKWARKALSMDQTRADAAAVLARATAAAGNPKKAVAELEKAWTANPHPALFGAYMQLMPGEPPLARAGRIEKLVAGATDHPESRLALAETALSAELWGQARSRLEPLLDKGVAAPTRARAAALMAQVELGENGDTKAATKCLVIALEARTAAPEVPPPVSAADLLSRKV